MTFKYRFFLFPLMFLHIICQPALAVDGTIKIGFNLPFSGMFETVGNHSKNAAELVHKQLSEAGGLKVGDKTFDVEFIYGDNGSNPTTATALTVDQIAKDKVLGIIGPLSSTQAVPVGQMANAFSTPMMTPWSTSPLTTKARPFVFRSCFVYTIQGQVITQFSANEFKATKAAVLYDILNVYSRGLAKSFKEAFEAVNGAGSVVAFLDFRTKDVDFNKQLQRIKATDAQFIFSPQFYNEIPLIVKQAKAIDLEIPIVGSNSWAGGDLVGECGNDCEGLFFTGNYAPGGATGINKKFVDEYAAAYGENPDEPAALTWDAVRVFLQAVSNTGNLTGNILNDRVAVKNAMMNIKNFDGASGMMSFDETGDPNKCAVIVKIDKGILTFHDSVCL